MYCGYGYGTISGKVTPATATSKVVLQRTENGKWVDWKWYNDSVIGIPAALLTAKPAATGSYKIRFTTLTQSVDLAGRTLHLRVRSNGGTTSPGVYAKVPTPSDPCI